MKLTDDELSDEYKEGMKHLTDFLAKREEWREMIRTAPARGVRVSPEDHAYVLSQLHEFDNIVDDIETGLAKEYDRLLDKKRAEAEIKEEVDKSTEACKRLYIIIKHTKPELLDEFTKTLDRLTDDEREQFLDDVAILEATNLQAILTGTA